MANDQHFGEPMELRVLISALWVGRTWILTAVVLCTAGFLAAAFLIKPVYRASAVLISASAERNNMSGGVSSAFGSLGGLASLAGISVGTSDAATEESLAVLESRQFTEAFVRDLDLLPKLFPSKWDATAQKWKVNDDDRPTPVQAYLYFDKQIRTVVQDKKTGLITLQIDWVNRDESALWANELVRRLNAEMRSRALSKAEASVGYLETELAKTTEIETRGAISRLVEAQIRQRMLANVTQDYAFRVVDPAMIPDKANPIRPRKLALVLAGPLVGLAFGIVYVLAMRAISNASKPEIRKLST
jgi:uncharacterized protein involved in exopolysaccharide biosynthesis